MEKIRINAIDKKPSGLVIVKFQRDPTNPQLFEATLNTKWQSQEVDYLEKDVGIGGEVSVMIVQKGDYTNITKVDFASAVKGATQNAPITPAPVSKMGSSKENSIIAQCLTKIEYRNSPQPDPEDILKSYRFFLRKLDE